MIESKQTADLYSKLRLELTSKTSSLAKEIDVKKGEIIDGLRLVEKNQNIVKGYTDKAVVNIIKQFKEENRLLLDSYIKSGKEHRANEALFHDLFKKAKEGGLTNLDESAFKEALMGKTKKKESREVEFNIPSAVTAQEKKAIEYFERNNEPNHIKVVEHIQKLRAEGKINYEDLGGGKYAVIMSCGDTTLKIYFPPDTTLSDSTYKYIDWDENEYSKKDISMEKLCSNEGKKHFEQKTKEGQRILHEGEFKKLIQQLYPEGTEQEQILAFMMATGFYGQMWLADKTQNSQAAALCLSDNRDLWYMENNSGDPCSLVHTTFIG